MEFNANHVPKGVEVHGKTKVFSVPTGEKDRLNFNVHGSRVLGGPYKGVHSVGGGVEYQHDNGIKASIDVTQHKPQMSTVVQTQAQVPVQVSDATQVDLKARDVRTYGGPFHGARSAGAALEVKHDFGAGNLTAYGSVSKDRFHKPNKEFGLKFKADF